MPWFDLPLEQLRGYRTSTGEPPDLGQWWRTRLEKARATGHHADELGPRSGKRAGADQGIARPAGY